MKRHDPQRRPSASRLKALIAAAIASVAVPPVQAHAGGLVGSRAEHLAVAQPQAADVTAAHLDNDAETATLTFDLSQDLKPAAFVLADPDRVVVDLPQVNFLISPSIGSPWPRRHRSAKKSGGLVEKYRFGLLGPGRSRILIDLHGPASITAAAVRTVGGASKLIIQLAKTDRKSFQTAAAKQTLETLAPNSPVAVSRAPDLRAPERPTVVLDPGHGGPDTGAIVNGVVEKDVALGFAKLLASKLEAGGKLNVVLSRSTDVFIPLSERVRIAREANANLMVSIHTDTLPDTPDVSGATVYTVSDKASDAYAARVAAKENQSDLAVGLDGQADTADVNDILFDLTRQETRAYSHVFSRTLVNYWKVVGHLNKNPQRAAGFVVLKAPDVPSVLLELGYLSSPADTTSLVSDDWREKATSRMAEAINAYFAERHGLPAKSVASVSDAATSAFGALAIAGQK